ncbi:MAG: SPOR domain-containing protein, partial [Microvirga sp.]
PHPLVEPAPAAAAAAKIEARLPEMTVPKPEPVARPEILAKAEPTLPSPPAAEPHRLRASPAPVSRWVIQLGAPDDEGKAKDILEEARSRSRGVLAKASPFTEKVVRDGATLYRARFSGFDEADSANEACRSLKRNGFACFATRS